MYHCFWLVNICNVALHLAYQKDGILEHTKMTPTRSLVFSLLSRDNVRDKCVAFVCSVSFPSSAFHKRLPLVHGHQHCRFCNDISHKHQIWKRHINADECNPKKHFPYCSMVCTTQKCLLQNITRGKTSPSYPQIFVWPKSYSLWYTNQDHKCLQNSFQRDYLCILDFETLLIWWQVWKKIESRKKLAMVWFLA